MRRLAIEPALPLACGGFDLAVDLHPREVCVESPLTDEFVMRSTGNDSSAIDHKNPVGAAYGRQSSGPSLVSVCVE